MSEGAQRAHGRSRSLPRTGIQSDRSVAEVFKPNPHRAFVFCELEVLYSWKGRRTKYSNGKSRRGKDLVKVRSRVYSMKKVGIERERAGCGGWMNEVERRTNERTNKRTNEQTNERTNERIEVRCCCCVVVVVVIVVVVVVKVIKAKRRRRRRRCWLACLPLDDCCKVSFVRLVLLSLLLWSCCGGCCGGCCGCWLACWSFRLLLLLVVGCWLLVVGCCW